MEAEIVMVSCHLTTPSYMFSFRCLFTHRFSYGPPMSNLEKGIRQMEKMIQHWEENSLSISTYQRESFGDEDMG